MTDSPIFINKANFRNRSAAMLILVINRNTFEIVLLYLSCIYYYKWL